jgi:hypothetical protein
MKRQYIRISEFFLQEYLAVVIKPYDLCWELVIEVLHA